MDHLNNVHTVSREHGPYPLWDVPLLSQEHHQSPIPACHWGSTGKTQGLWRPSHFSNNTRGSRRQHSWENLSTLKCLQLENKACKVCTKKSLYLTVIQPQFLQGVKDAISWLTLADKLCSLPAQLQHCSQAISSDFLGIGNTSKQSGKTNLWADLTPKYFQCSWYQLVCRLVLCDMRKK